jgi:hypothetical protein
MKEPFKQIILINQNDGRPGAGCLKSGIEIEDKKSIESMIDPEKNNPGTQK